MRRRLEGREGKSVEDHGSWKCGLGLIAVAAHFHIVRRHAEMV